MFRVFLTFLFRAFLFVAVPWLIMFGIVFYPMFKHFFLAIFS